MKYVLATIKQDDIKQIFSGERTYLKQHIKPSDIPAKVFIYEPFGDGEGAGKIVGEFMVTTYWNFSDRKFAWNISDLCKYVHFRTLEEFELKRPPVNIQYIPKAVIKRNNL